MSYKVTVIIPSYNSVSFLDETIDSIKKQTIGFENIELIIVDDYSTDNTQELINSYCKQYENIKTYESGKKTGTPGRARNIAIEHAQADYVMFIDHDDKYVEDTVEKLYTAIVENQSDVAIGKYQNFGENNIATEGWITQDVTLNSIDENLLFFSINGIWRMIFPVKFLKQHEIRFPEGVFAEDLTFMINVFLNASKIVFINNVVYKFRLRSGEDSSTSLSKGMHYLDGLINGYLYTIDVLKENNGMKYYDTVFNQHLSCWLSDVALSQTIRFEDKKELIAKSKPLFKQMTNVAPFPENNPIKNMINSIRNDDLKLTYKQMDDYRKLHYLEAQNESWFSCKIKQIKSKLRK